MCRSLSDDLNNKNGLGLGFMANKELTELIRPLWTPQYSKEEMMPSLIGMKN